MTTMMTRIPIATNSIEEGRKRTMMTSLFRRIKRRHLALIAYAFGSYFDRLRQVTMIPQRQRIRIQMITSKTSSNQIKSKASIPIRPLSSPIDRLQSPRLSSAPLPSPRRLSRLFSHSPLLRLCHHMLCNRPLLQLPHQRLSQRMSVRHFLSFF